MFNTNALLWLALAGAIWIASHFQPYDDTDTPPKRSGLTVFVDPATGCQYLRAPPFGAPVPRLNADGKQIC